MSNSATVDGSFMNMKTMLELYLVYLFRVCDKDEAKFRSMIQGCDERRAYIFRPKTYSALFWKMILVTLGKHNLRCFHPIGHEFTIGARFLCMNLKPPNDEDRIYLDGYNRAMSIPGLKQEKINETFQRNHFFKILTFSGGNLNKFVMEQETESFQKDVFDQAVLPSKTVLDYFFNNYLLNKTMVPFEYVFAYKPYKDIFDSEEESDTAFVNKFWLKKTKDDKERSLTPSNAFQWWIRFCVSRLYSDAISSFAGKSLSPEGFIAGCSLNYGSIGDISGTKEEKFGLIMLGKAIGGGSGAIWNHIPNVHPAIFVLLSRMSFMALSGYWKMKDEKFEVNTLMSSECGRSS